MEYTEAGDFEEKAGVIEAMSRRCQSAGVPIDFSGARVLEIGGAGGVLGGLISGAAQKTIVTDIVDVQVQYGGQFPKLLLEKFERNGRSLDLSRIEFHADNAMDLPYRDGLFDVVLSNNAFEHIPDPFQALREVLRVLKEPGGVAYLTFDPIWTADNGSHFSHYIKEPWAHLLQSTDEFVANMRKAGAAEWEVSDFVHGLNRMPCSEYKKRLHDVLGSAGVTRYTIDSWSGCVDPASMSHPNRARASSDLCCAEEDLLVGGFYVLLQK